MNAFPGYVKISVFILFAGAFALSFTYSLFFGFPSEITASLLIILVIVSLVDEKRLASSYPYLFVVAMLFLFISTISVHKNLIGKSVKKKMKKPERLERFIFY
jgi:uncharacterized membrane protein